MTFTPGARLGRVNHERTTWGLIAIPAPIPGPLTRTTPTWKASSTDSPPDADTALLGDPSADDDGDEGGEDDKDDEGDEDGKGDEGGEGDKGGEDGKDDDLARTGAPIAALIGAGAAIATGGGLAAYMARRKKNNATDELADETDES